MRPRAIPRAVELEVAAGRPVTGLPHVEDPRKQLVRLVDVRPAHRARLRHRTIHDELSIEGYVGAHVVADVLRRLAGAIPAQITRKVRQRLTEPPLDVGILPLDR